MHLYVEAVGLNQPPMQIFTQADYIKEPSLEIVFQGRFSSITAGELFSKF